MCIRDRDETARFVKKKVCVWKAGKYLTYLISAAFTNFVTHIIPHADITNVKVRKILIVAKWEADVRYSAS